ncbi:hypothetical protein FOZ61_007223 [Perkinsus olseni]|uniref:Uncharacterized protein n=1 Tax=Perkinsus olseni TaxID=32597 RepID=A0A7J6LA15_PEROL|nr:hypothetical protein FOZ61_007223 [Perkinsus olseni]
MALRAKDADFENFASQARSLMGNDLADDWLQEMWSGADGDLNRALNHVLDSPPDKIKRSGSSSAPAPVPVSTKSSKSSKKKKHSRTSAPPPPTTPAWGDEYDDPFFSAPAPAPAPPAAPAPPPEPATMQAPPAPPPPSQQPVPQQMPASAPQLMGPQMGMPNQPMLYPYPPQQAPQMMQTMPAVSPAPGTMENYPPNATSNPMAASSQQQQRIQFMQSQQQQVLLALKAQLDTVLANPALLQDPAAMHQLKDTMSMAMEAPNATIQMSEQARQNQQAAQFISLMQNQVSEMLSNPQVASNPELLQQLNTQMNQLRLITMQQVASEKLSSNPVTALSLSSTPNSAAAKPFTAEDIRSILESAVSDSDSDDSDEELDDDTEWWDEEASKGKREKGNVKRTKKHVSFNEDSPKKDAKKGGSDPSLSESNPFKEPEAEDETISGEEGQGSARPSREGRKGSRKGHSDKEGLDRLMKRLMAAQSQLRSSASMQPNPAFPNNSVPVLPNMYNMSQGNLLPSQSMSTMMPPTGYALPSVMGTPGVPPSMMNANPTATYNTQQQQQPPYY